MIVDILEKDILISAPAETVYQAITEPGHISQWFADAADLNPVPGEEGRLTFADRATSQRMTAKLTVQIAERPRAFAFRWDYPDGEQPTEDNSLLVTFTLAAEGTATRLRLTESGFAASGKPDAEQAGYYAAHDKGWDAHLASLFAHVADES